MLINYVKENQSSILADYKKTVYSFKNLEIFMSIYFKGIKYDNCPQRDNIIDNLYEYTRNRKQYIYNDISKGIINTKEDDIHTHQYLDFTTTEEDNKKFHESLSKGYEKYQPYGYDEAYSQPDIGSQSPSSGLHAGIINIGTDRYETVVDSDNKIVAKKGISKADLTQYLEDTIAPTPMKEHTDSWMDDTNSDYEKKRAEIAQKLQDAALQVAMGNSAKNVKARRSSQQFRTTYNPNVYMSSDAAKAYDEVLIKKLDNFGKIEVEENHKEDNLPW